MKDSLEANRALFILLTIFVFRFSQLGTSLFGGGSTLHDLPDLLFKIELLIILLYTLVNKALPDKTITNNRLVLYGFLAWVSIISIKYAVDAHTGIFGSDSPYLYMVFHGVFAVYAIAIIREMRLIEDAGHLLLFSSKKMQERVLLGLLCVLTFSIALTNGYNSFNTAEIVLKHEYIFIFAYVFIFKSVPDLSRFFKEHRIATLLLVLWFLSVTASFLFSPYMLITAGSAVGRYQQTLFHAAFFIFAYQFLIDMDIKKDRVIMLMLPLSVVVHAAIFVITWLSYIETAGVDWFVSPPLSSHIRHTGYIATAASVVAMMFMLHERKTAPQMILYFVLFLVTSTFLIWIGGRASTLSFIGTLFLAAAYLAYVRKLRLNQLVFTCATIVLAVYLAEALKIFDWNGISRQLSVTQKAENVDMLMSYRPEIWMSVVESLKGHWLFGLGSQGYYFMPNRVGITVQPHSMFLQFLAEWGVLGASVFIVLLLLAGLSIIMAMTNKARVASPGMLSSVAVIVALSIHGLVDGTYYHAQPSFYIVLSFAVCLSAIIGKHSSRPSQQLD